MEGREDGNGKPVRQRYKGRKKTEEKWVTGDVCDGERKERKSSRTRPQVGLAQEKV